MFSVLECLSIVVLLGSITALIVTMQLRRIRLANTAKQQLAEFLTTVRKFEVRLSSVQNRSGRCFRSLDADATYAIYELQKALGYADELFSYANTLISINSMQSLQDAVELFDAESESNERNEALVRAGAVINLPMSPEFWKRYVEGLLQKAEKEVCAGLQNVQSLTYATA